MLFAFILIVFITVGSGLLFAFALIGGWGSLAKRYPADHAPPGAYYRFRSASFSGIGYNNMLTVGICDEGLYLAVFFLFRVAHPPMLLPWSEVIDVHENRFWSLSACNVTIGEREQVIVTLPMEAMPLIREKTGLSEVFD
ncbi:hypothetical protein AB1K70_05200 [Bremerella sp. JC770]|uniref:hypothetical protein n=1 Tax=Bremerella sp. JC770 TaxID=3232137 RepID=UPI003457C56E